MRWLSGVRVVLKSLFRSRAERELQEEFEYHLDRQIEEGIARGLSQEEARFAALRAMGAIEKSKDECRDVRGGNVIDETLADLRYSVRVLRKNRGFAVVVILSLAVGIGANTAIFSLLHAVILQPLAYADPDRLFAARDVRRTNTTAVMPVNPVHAFAWTESSSVERVAILRPSRAQLETHGETVLLQAGRVSRDFFALLGQSPILGRTFVAEEEQPGRDRVVVLTEALWRSRFNADPAIAGTSIEVDGEPHEVIGVVPGTFWRALSGGIPTTPSNTQLMLFRPQAFAAEELQRFMGNYNYAALVRLKPGATVQQAVAEINVIQSRFPKMTGDEGTLEAQLIPLHLVVTGRSLGVWMLAGAVAMVLLVVCVNLANLLLARVASRGREAAVRTALGASRGRQFRLVLTESLLLSTAGGGVGILLATWIVDVLGSTASLNLPRIDTVQLNTPVLLFALALTIVTGILFGVLPAWRITRNDPIHALRAGSHTVTEGRGGLRLRETLIGIEVALSAALLIVAGLLATSLDRLLRVDKGFDPERVLTFAVDTAGPRYEDAGPRGQFFDRLLEKFEAIPGVEAAGLTSALPLSGNTWNDPIYLENRTTAADRHSVDNRFVSPGFFRAIDIPVLHGRMFDDTDRKQSVAVLSKKAAQILWPDVENPVGRRFMGEDDAVKILVGVVGDVRANLHEEPTPHAYYPFWQRVPGDVVMVVRTSARPESAAGALRAALLSEDPQLPIAPVRAMQDVVDGVVAQRRFQSTLVVVFAISALLVAGLGIYGAVAYSVARRRNEIGIRMALGAARWQLLRLILRQGMTPVAIGLAGGVAIALLIARALQGLLFGVQPADPATIAAVVVVLLAVSVVACLVPARRATSRNTVEALRFE